MFYMFELAAYQIVTVRLGKTDVESLIEASETVQKLVWVTFLMLYKRNKL